MQIPDIPLRDYEALINTFLIAIIGGLIGWFAQDMRRRVTNIERRLGATVRGMFYLVTHDDDAPQETRAALEEAMKDKI